MRGYNREEVDRAVKDLRRELISANSANNDTQKELKRLSAQAEELSAELEEAGSPTYSGLGHRLENTLRIAEQQATRRIAQAAIDAGRLRSGVQADVDGLKREAAGPGEPPPPGARNRAEDMLEAARAEVDDMTPRAQDAAEQALQDASREAAAIRGGVA